MHVAEYLKNLLFFPRKRCPHQIENIKLNKIKFLEILGFKIIAQLAQSLNQNQKFLNDQPFKEQSVEFSEL